MTREGRTPPSAGRPPEGRPVPDGGTPTGESDGSTSQETATPDGAALNGLMFVGQYNPGARFAIVSPVVDWTPDVREVSELETSYNTRVIRYLNVGEYRILFNAETNDLPPYVSERDYVVDANRTGDEGTPQPEVFRFTESAEPVRFEQSLLLRVNFEPVTEAQEDDVLDDEDWWQ